MVEAAILETVYHNVLQIKIKLPLMSWEREMSSGLRKSRGKRLSLSLSIREDT